MRRTYAKRFEKHAGFEISYLKASPKKLRKLFDELNVEKMTVILLGLCF